MTEAGFFQQKSGSPVGLAAIVAIHAAVFAALILIKGPQILRHINDPINIIEIVPPHIPPPVDLPPTQDPQPSRMTVVTPNNPLPPLVVTGDPPDRILPPFMPPGPERIVIAARPEIPPVRRDAEIVARNLQPPYPESEIREQRNGQVRLRVTIGPDGRVIALERLSATSDAFWLSTQRHAMRSWRFRPATLDGRPVESVKVMTVTFRIGEA